jgi:hypothetical protein
MFKAVGMGQDIGREGDVARGVRGVRSVKNDLIVK